MDYKCGDCAGRKAGDGLNQAWREADMVIF
jgi:hypothetical protein